MAAAPADPWIVDFEPNGPRFTAPATGFTVFKVPKHLRGAPFDYDKYFKIEMLQLGLQNRTLAPDAPEKVIQNFKLEIAFVLHDRLSRIPPARAPLSTPTPPVMSAPLPPVSIIRSWDDFAKVVVDNADTARKHFEKPADNPPMSDHAVQNHLALDALFVVFYFQYLNASTFNIEEFRDLARDRSATLKSLGLSDFLLLENQVPMYLLKKVVEELCKIDDEVSTKLGEVILEQDPSGDPFDHLVENELNNVLLVAIWNLLPISEPTIVPDPFASMTIFARVVERMRTIASSTGACMDRNRGCRRETEFPGSMLVKYLHTYYPPHTDHHSLEKCKHILDCVYRVACGHDIVDPQWDKEQFENPFLETIPSATQLEEVGIKAKHSTQCTANSVELTHGCLTWIRSARFKLPKLEILDHTARHFHNLAIYEQLLGRDMPQYNSDMRCYLVCMHDLCRDAADLQLLSKRGVINVHVRHDLALSMWGKILEGVERPIPSDAWKNCYNNVHNHRHTRWKRWRRKRFGMFFSQPWKKLSILAAIVLLFLTSLQTWFTVVNAVSRKARWPPRI